MVLKVAVLIDAPLDRVWDAASDLASHAEWMTDAEAIRFRGQQTKGVGTVIEVLTRVGPLSTTDVMQVVAWDPPRMIGVRHVGLVSGRGEFCLDPVAGGVILTWSEDLRFPRRFGGPIGAWLARPLLRWLWGRNLQRFRNKVEQS